MLPVVGAIIGGVAGGCIGRVGVSTAGKAIAVPLLAMVGLGALAGAGAGAAAKGTYRVYKEVKVRRNKRRST